MNLVLAPWPQFLGCMSRNRRCTKETEDAPPRFLDLNVLRRRYPFRELCSELLDPIDAAAAAGEPIDTTDALKAYFAETTGENLWEKCTADLEPYTDAAVALAAETGVDAWDAAVGDAEADCAFYEETERATWAWLTLLTLGHANAALKTVLHRKVERKSSLSWQGVAT